MFELNTFGGDDTLTTAPGLGALIAVVADGGSGNDTLHRRRRVRHVLRRPRRRHARPRRRRRRRGRRPGRQRHADGPRRLRPTSPAAAPAPTPRPADREDVLIDVESADVPPAPAGGRHHGHRGARRRPSASRRSSRRACYTAKIRVSCPASEAGGCNGILVLQTARTGRLGGTRFHAIVASKRYTLQQRADQDPQGQAAQGRPRAQPPRHAQRSTPSPRTATRRATSPSARRGSRSSWSASRLGGARRVPVHQLALHAARLAGPAACGASSCRRRRSSHALVSSAKQRSSVSSRSPRSVVVAHRREQLDARVEVARHQVGRADVDRRARRRARRRRCASARGSARRSRRRGCSPRRPGRPAAGSRCRGC